MPILSIDIETYSDVDLAKCGVYAYSDSPNFEILLFAYAFDEEPTRITDLACGEKLPQKVLDALEDPAITKTAFNAQFERTCISRYLGRRLSPNGWQCTAVQSAMLALPLSLDNVGEVLDIQRKKLKEGTDLVRFFSMPCKPTKANGGRTRNRPEDAPEKWERFKTYCIRDVDAEREIRQKLWKFPIPESEMELYRMDQEINDRGILVDQQLVENAVLCDNQYRQMVSARAYELTGLSNPNSPAQIKGWLAEHGVEAEKLDKKTVKGLISETDGEVLEVLKLRLLMAKTSVKKYEAIERSVCSDGRVHGLLQFYGANRTGRWAGRLVQVQNLPQNHIPDLELARSLVKEHRFEDLDLLYDSTPEVLSELIRTAFVPKPGCRFIVADFSAIEARVLAWFAGEQWRLDTFVEGGDIYCASASKMFGVPVIKHGVNGHLRQKGKIAELALGYGGAVGALTSMGALDMGLQEEELQPLVSQWRNSNPHITKFWWDVDAAAIKAVKERTEVVLGNVIHYGFIERFIEQLGEKYHIIEIAYDRWNATQMVQNLEDMGFTMVPFGQGFKDMSPPSKELYKLLMEGNIIHGGNPVLKWMAQNVVMRQDPAGNIKPDKERSVEKIDGIVALIMGLDRCIRSTPPTSVYDERGILFI